MMLLRARDNAHGKLVVPANPAKIRQTPTIDVQGAVPILTEALIPDKVMTLMDDPDMVRADTATLTKIRLNLPENDRVKHEIFMNVLIPTTNLTKDIINSIACPGDHARKPRRA
jgi:hypothetical protein